MNNRYLEKILFSQEFCFLSLISFVALILMGLFSISETIEPLKITINSLFSHGKINFNLMFLLEVLVKAFFLLILFSVIGFFLYSITSTLYSCVFSDLLTRKYAGNKYHIKNILQKSIGWNLCRLSYIFMPIVIILAFSLFLFTVGFFLFNFLLKLAGINLTIFTFIISFCFYMVIFGFVGAVIFSFKRFLFSMFGINTLIKNMNLKDDELKNKSSDIFGSRLVNFVIAPLYLLFSLIITVQICLGMLDSSFLSEEKLIVTFSIIFIDIVLWIGLSYLRAYLFSKSLFIARNRLLVNRQNILENKPQ